MLLHLLIGTSSLDWKVHLLLTCEKVLGMAVNSPGMNTWFDKLMDTGMFSRIYSRKLLQKSLFLGKVKNKHHSDQTLVYVQYANAITRHRQASKQLCTNLFLPKVSKSPNLKWNHITTRNQWHNSYMNWLQIQNYLKGWSTRHN